MRVTTSWFKREYQPLGRLDSVRASFSAALSVLGGCGYWLDLKALGKCQPQIACMENRLRRIDVVELLDLAEIIGFDPHEMLDELMKTPRK